MEERLRIRLLPVIIATVIGLSAQASAAREYYLVGLRHIYMFDVWPDTHKQERQAIEEQFAASVASAQQLYDADMAAVREEEARDNGNLHQIDRDAIQQNIEQSIAEAGDARDEGLSQLYVQCDYIRNTHQEFQVDQDGPYQVMGCDVTPTGDFQCVYYYKPYPSYPGPCPFDWTWEHPYPYSVFNLQMRLYHSTWLSIGSPVFAPMYYGDTPVVVLAPIRQVVILNRSSWSNGRPPAISEDDRMQFAALKALQRKAGIRPPSKHPGVTRVAIAPPVGDVSKYVKVRVKTEEANPGGSRYNHIGSRLPIPGNPSGGSVIDKPVGDKTLGNPVTAGSAHVGTATKNPGGVRVVHPTQTTKTKNDRKKGG